MIKLNKNKLALLLGSTVLLSGCGTKKSDCNEVEYHLHKYRYGGLSMYMECEDIKNGSFTWTKDYKYSNLGDKKFNQFLQNNRLLKFEENKNYLTKISKLNNDFTEYRYYYKYRVQVKDGDNYKTIIRDGYSWTTNPKEVGLTGEERHCHYLYQAYKIEENENGEYNLISSNYVDNILELEGEYPYIKEDYYKIIVLENGMTPSYENGSKYEKDYIEDYEIDWYEEGNVMSDEEFYQKYK